MVEFQIIVQLTTLGSSFSAMYYFLMLLLALAVSPYSFKKIFID